MNELPRYISPRFEQGYLTLRTLQTPIIFYRVLVHFLTRSSSSSKTQFCTTTSKIAMDPTQDFKSLQDQIQAALISTTRTTGQISSEDLGFQRSLNPEVGTALDEQSERLLSLATALLKSAASISQLRAPVLEEADDVDNNWRGIVDVVDSLLEKSDTCLDEYTGVIKRNDPILGEQAGQVFSSVFYQWLNF
jgi:hypothetical protein